MRGIFRVTVIVVFLWLPVMAQEVTPLQPDPPISCKSCLAWNADHVPFQIFANTYYVGVAGLSSILITSDDGLILIDGGLPQSVASIDASIRRLGFRTEDVRLILNSHAHYDHAGGIAALQRASGASVAASAASALALEQGAAVEDDPQYAFADRFPPVRGVKIIESGETLRIGNLAVTAHLTPGHTPGSTTWTWRSCDAQRCLDIVYADSLNPVSAPGFSFTGNDLQPGIIGRFRRSIETVALLPCDILISVHPEFSGMDEKLERRAQGFTPDPFIDPSGCSAYAAAASRSLDRRIAAEP